MRRFLLFALAATLFAACTKDAINEPTGIILDDNRTLTVSFEGDTEDTRIQLNEEKKSVWTEGDLLSVFYRSTTNEQWQFAGKTGDRTGNILPVDSSVVPTPTTNEIVVVYPYNAGYFYNSDTKNVQASLPAEQSYLKDSYGLDGNIMVSHSEYNQVSLKSVCGWLKLQLTGAGETVKSITLRGNAGEQVAGELYINTSDATSTLASELAESGDDGEVSGTLVRPGTIHTEVTLNCGAGVALDAEATAFYIALPPMTFENGFTVDIIATDGSIMTKSTDKALAIERNYIQPMSAFAYTPTTPATPKPANNEIWYTNGSTTTATTPYSTTVFGANIVSNLYDAEKECWVITFDGDVTMIGYQAFNAKNLTGITIPDSVTTIGSNAFYNCSKLKNIHIPQNVTEIKGAFSGCTSLVGVHINDIVSWCSINFDSTNPLYYAKNLYLNGELITDLVIPKEASLISDRAFQNCTCITSITIEDGVTSIGKATFSGCSSLTSVTIPSSVTYIGNSAFAECTGTLYTDSGYMDCNIVYDNYYGTTSNVGSYIGSAFTEVIFGSNVKLIPPKAFVACTTIERVSFGKDVVLIGESAFSGCSNLTSTNLPENIREIETKAFSGCNITTDIRLDKYVILGSGALTGFYGKVYINYDVPSSYLSNCNFTEVVLGDRVTSIGSSAFYGCTKMSKLTLPEGLTTIGSSAFDDCDSLISVTIPSSVTYMGDKVFLGCNALKTAYVKPTTPPYMGEKGFSYFSGGSTYYELDTNIYVPASDDNSIINAYKAATGWSSYRYDIHEYDFSAEE